MKKLNIAKSKLHELYIKQYLSAQKIGERLGCNRQTIINYLKFFQIPLHSPSQARIRYRLRKDFNGSFEDKSYMLGFRLGDLNVYKVSENSETIIVRCHTTNDSQVNLIKGIFNNYGRVKISIGKHGYTVNCYLNMSFDFLLPKSDSVPEWIEQSKSFIIAFIAGYIDAEGTFQINQKRGRFALTTCDKEILYWIHKQLISYNIKSLYRKVSNKGTKSIGSYMFSEDVWRVNINESNSLFNFIQLLESYLKHEKRVIDMLSVMKNIHERRIKGTI